MPPPFQVPLAAPAYTRASGGEEAGGRRGQPRAAHVRRRDGGGAAAVVEERVELEPDGVDGGLHVPRCGVALGDVLEVEEEGRHDAQPVRHGEEGRGQPDHQVGDGGEGERRVGAFLAEDPDGALADGGGQLGQQRASVRAGEGVVQGVGGGGDQDEGEGREEREQEEEGEALHVVALPEPRVLERRHAQRPGAGEAEQAGGGGGPQRAAVAQVAPRRTEQRHKVHQRQKQREGRQVSSSRGGDGWDARRRAALLLHLLRGGACSMRTSPS
mmetsp:Transcript_36682/g.117646  ORF Transcript_36682/g.117646 Transcript_36682/m.117646 type:complete len:271 (+) Transcript_36682:370-1182(+)